MKNLNEITPELNSEIVEKTIKILGNTATKKQFDTEFKKQVESLGYNFKQYNSYMKKYF